MGDHVRRGQTRRSRTASSTSSSLLFSASADSPPRPSTFVSPSTVKSRRPDKGDHRIKPGPSSNRPVLRCHLIRGDCVAGIVVAVMYTGDTLSALPAMSHHGVSTWLMHQTCNVVSVGIRVGVLRRHHFGNASPRPPYSCGAKPVLATRRESRSNVSSPPVPSCEALIARAVFTPKNCVTKRRQTGSVKLWI